MNDQDTQRQLARAAMTAQKVNSVQNLGAAIGFFGGGALWLWLLYEPMADSTLAWFGGGLVAAFIGAYVVSRTFLALMAR